MLTDEALDLIPPLDGLSGALLYVIWGNDKGKCVDASPSQSFTE